MTRLESLPSRYKQQTAVEKRPRKFRNTPTEYNGCIFHSKKEAQVAQELDLMVWGKALKDWNNQVAVSFDVTTDGRLVARCKNIYLPKPDPKDRVADHICRHDIDFLLVHPDNSIELVEVKSSATRTRIWRLKYKLLAATLLRSHPKIKYTIKD